MDAASLLLGVVIMLLSVAIVRLMDSSPIPIVIQSNSHNINSYPDPNPEQEWPDDDQEEEEEEEQGDLIEQQVSADKSD